MQWLGETDSGCLSFWIAGEMGDAMLPKAFRAGALTLLLGFASPARRAAMATLIRPLSMKL